MIVDEVPPERAHSTISMIFEISSCCGATLVLLVNFIAAYYYQWGRRLSFGAAGIPAAFLCWTAYPLVETPPRVESGWRSDLVELLSSHSRPILMINIMAVVCRQLAGLSVFIFFGPFLLQSSGYAENEAFLAPLVASAIGTASTGCLAYFLRAVGRRMMLFIGCIATFTAQICIWIVFFLEGDTFFHLKKIDAYIIILSLAPIYAFGVAALSEPSGWLKDPYLARSKPLKCRSPYFARCRSAPLLPLLWYLLFQLHLYFFFVPETEVREKEEMVEQVWRRH